MAKRGDLKDVKWRKINAPTVWHPKPGEELIGYYGGRTKRDGRFGPYEVLIVLVPYRGAFMVSGTQVVQLADTAMLRPSDAVRVRYLGKKELPDDRTMKLFELYIGEMEAAEDMPDLAQPEAE